MNTEANYLHISINDNDFWVSHSFTCELLQNIFKFKNSYPTEQDLPALRKAVKNLWYAVYSIDKTLDRGNVVGEYLDYFDRRLCLEIVNYHDIQNWCDGTNIYIPLFDGDIIVR